YLGETKTISGVYSCKFEGSRTISGQHDRYWNGEITYTEGDNFVHKEETKTLAVQPHMIAGYFMGDPLHGDRYQVYGLEGPEPYAEYYDYENDISITEYEQDEELAAIGFRFTDFSYAQPIENSFSFSGVEYEADNIIFFVALMLVFLLVCIIFVRKDKEYKYSYLDKSCIIVNFIVGIIAVPFISLICTMFGLTGSGYEWIDQCIYNIPSFTILCLALSVMLRRKGYSKQGFFVQFGGILAFVLMLLTDLI
ncbi:MAG: hypothetical protein UHD05_06970, partial [Ruminococcus sp.]|nr:hypothetical protein [Ruminococcus sp.]